MPPKLVPKPNTRAASLDRTIRTRAMGDNSDNQNGTDDTGEASSLTSPPTMPMADAAMFSNENVQSIIEALQRSQTEALRELFVSVSSSRTSTPVSCAAQGQGTLTACKTTFSGKRQESVEAFIDAIDAYSECAQVTDANILRGLAFLFKENAATWWQGVKQQTTSWSQAKENLVSAFGDRRPPHRIYIEIFSSPQQTENTDVFVARIRSLFARLPEGDISEKAQLDMTYGLLSNRIRKRLRREDFTSFKELLRRARSVEDSFDEGERKATPPQATDRAVTSNQRAPPASTTTTRTSTSHANSSAPTAAAPLRAPKPFAPAHSRAPPTPTQSGSAQAAGAAAAVPAAADASARSQRPICGYCRRYGHSKEECRKLLNSDPSTDFSKHNIVKPKLQHGRTKRQIISTRDTSGSHHPEVTITLNIDGEEHELALRLNEALVPRGHSLSYQQDGRTKVHVPEKEEMDLCQYSGHVRGRPGSWAAVSTCHGVKGVIYDGRQLRYIEPGHGNVESEHFMYSHEHLTKQHHCGHKNNSTHYSHNDPVLPPTMVAQNRSIASRYKRHASEEWVRKPYNADKRSRYVELVLVVDHREFLASGRDLLLVHQQMKDLANIINSVYAPLNIFIALVGVEVWTENDKITLSPSSDVTLDNFNQYRSTDLVKRLPNDNAHLITRQSFDGGVVGKAYLATICTNQKSAGVETNHSIVSGIVAMTVAHEMGHNFGMDHDKNDCECHDRRCIMGDSTSESMVPAHWSSCSLRYLHRSFEKGLDYCLRNEPERLFGSSTCGNGFLEEGEQCDCGTAPGALFPKESDRNACTQCCKPDCTLRANATCGHGQCCDLTTCRPKAPGTECRTADRECDLPEFCSGTSPFCPRDVHKMDATPCGKGQAYCVRGSCRTHTEQCQLLWGITGKRTDDVCYQEHNIGGDEYGNCGYDPVSKKFRRCAPQDVLCGMLQCSHLGKANKIEFGDFQTARTLSYPVYKDKNLIIPCHMAIIDLGLRDVDPGLVPDGAKCGHDKMCMQQRCLPIEQVREMASRAAGSVCPSDCSGHGVCNSNGNCHCDAGYAPPLCSLPGAGGSQDSGPIVDNSSLRRFMVAMYIIFLGIIPSIILILLLIYCCPCCAPLSLKIFKSHYKPSNLGSKFALPSFNTFGKWFYESNQIKRNNNCTKSMVEEKERKIFIVNNDLEDHVYAEISHVDKSCKIIGNSVPAQPKNIKEPIKFNSKLKEDIVIVENYNYDSVHNNDVNIPKVDDMKKKFESLSEHTNIPNFKDLNKELAILKNSKMGSPITRPKPCAMSKPNLSPKPAVSPKPGVKPKPNRLSENNTKPEIINAGLTSTTNEFLNKRSKLRKVGNINISK